VCPICVDGLTVYIVCSVMYKLPYFVFATVLRIAPDGLESAAHCIWRTRLHKCRHDIVCIKATSRPRVIKKAVLSQEEPCDAAVNFDRYRILQRHHAVSLSQHDYTSATIQNAEIKLHTVRWFSRPWREITTCWHSFVFTARCTLVQSAVLRSYIVCLSVCPWRWVTVITYVGILRK